ncbi:MAG: acetyl-CoA C-acetyltransferase [Actinomycetota bacterium]|nr:acetyl-CoA C-acetyltransferase [Actinomycetota bacterium]
MSNQTVIVGYARTPIARFSGGLAPLSATNLGAIAIDAALRKAGVAPEQVGYVVMGHVLQAGQGQITARQAAVEAGVPMTTPAVTVNKVCLSGMTAIADADRLIRAGDFDVVVAGGMESMTNAPYLLPQGRFGYRMGDGTLVDAMMWDGLTDPFEHVSMGAASDDVNTRLQIDREAQDEWAARSHERAVTAWKEGLFADEVVSVQVPSGRGNRGEAVIVEQDEGMRPGTTAERLAGLRPAFSQQGTITAGNASQISDGAAALVLTSRDKADELGLSALGTVRGWATVAGPDSSLHNQPSRAIAAVSERLGDDPAAYDLYEINEAFAAVAIQSVRDLGLDEDRVNVNGGAVALGHPIGATGARITITLLAELARRGGGRGVAALCGGGGQGDALVVDVSDHDPVVS